MIYFNPGHMTPEHLFQRFVVLARKSVMVGRRATMTRDNAQAETAFFGVLSQASEKEIELHSRSEHPVDHTIVHQGAPLCQPGDLIRTEDGRLFRVSQKPHDPGELGLWTVIYCEGRDDDGLN